MFSWIKYFFFFLLILSLYGCKDSDDIDKVDNNYLARFVAGVYYPQTITEVTLVGEQKEQKNSFKTKHENDFIISEYLGYYNRDIVSNTKTTWGTVANTTTWVANDSVGVFMANNLSSSFNYNNVAYIATTTSKSTPLLPASSPIYITDTNSFYDYFAYYPRDASGIVQTSSSTSLGYIIPSNQSDQSKVFAADLLAARTTAIKGSNTDVPLYFAHALALVSFQVKCRPNHVGKTLTKMTLQGSSITNKGVLDISAMTISPNWSAPFIIESNPNKKFTSTSTIIYVDMLVNPVYITSNSTGSQMLLTLTVGGSNYTTNVTNAVSFLPGRRYIYTITVR